MGEDEVDWGMVGDDDGMDESMNDGVICLRHFIFHTQLTSK